MKWQVRMAGLNDEVGGVVLRCPSLWVVVVVWSATKRWQGTDRR